MQLCLVRDLQLFSSAIYRSAHPAHCRIEAVENRFADEKMADVELGDLGQRRNLFGGDEIKPVAGVDFEAGAFRQPRAARDPFEFAPGDCGIAGCQRLAPGAGVDFDDGGGEGAGGLDLRRLGRDEQRHPDGAGAQLFDHAAQMLPLAGGIESAFGSALSPPLGNEAGGVRPQAPRDADHFRCRRHFQVEGFDDLLFEPNDVVVDDMAAVLAQMRGNAVGAGGDGNFGGAERIGLAAAACVAHRGDVVDIDAKADGQRSRHASQSPADACLTQFSILRPDTSVNSYLLPASRLIGRTPIIMHGRYREHQSISDYSFTRSALATTFFARSCEMIEVRCLRL